MHGLYYVSHASLRSRNILFVFIGESSTNCIDSWPRLVKRINVDSGCYCSPEMNKLWCVCVTLSQTSFPERESEWVSELCLDKGTTLVFYVMLCAIHQRFIGALIGYTCTLPVGILYIWLLGPIIAPLCFSPDPTCPLNAICFFFFWGAILRFSGPMDHGITHCGSLPYVLGQWGNEGKGGWIYTPYINCHGYILHTLPGVYTPYTAICDARTNMQPRVTHYNMWPLK